jgi:hypothetical protein
MNGTGAPGCARRDVIVSMPRVSVRWNAIDRLSGFHQQPRAVSSSCEKSATLSS